MDVEMKRRTFLKVSTAVVAATAVSSFKEAEAAEWKRQVGKSGSQPDPVAEEAKIVRSVCLMCHGGCGIQAKVVNGELVRLTGNPYHPNTYDYTAKGDIVEESDLDAGNGGKDVGSLCPKGQAGIFALYSPFRLQHPLKRVGPRGSGKWKSISWEQAIKEICHGGYLFKNVPGEENRKVEGLKSILNNNDPIGKEDSDYLDEAPPGGYGPKRNQFVWAHGRNEQSPLTPRFVTESAGVPNMLNHCSRCAGTFYNVVEDVLNLPPYEIGAYADYEYCDYLISLGSNITQADYPMQTRARYLQKFGKRVGPFSKEFKHVVVDPRFTNGAAKATHNGVGEWIPLKPATDAYFLLGMIRWMIENNGYKKEYLMLPNERAAKGRGYRNWTDMTYLVSTKEPKTYLAGKDAGLGQSDFVVLVNGTPKMFQEVDGTADLDASVSLNGVEYKTVFRMLRERAQEQTLEECDAVCDIPQGTIARIAKEFSAAKHPVIEMFRGPVQQSNGYWNGQALCIINILVDNVDRKGGFIPGHAAYKGGVKGTLRKASGVSVCRHKSKYQGKKPTASRPWYPLARRTVTPEFFASVKAGYPYKVKAYLNYYNNPVYTMPYNASVIDAMLDLNALPLTFSIDAYMGETTMLCDYVLPDTEYLERLGGFKTYPPVKTRVWALRQPVVGSFDPKTHDYRSIRPDTRMADDILIDLAMECGLPGFGKDGGGPGIHINNSWDYWNEYYKHYDFKEGLDPKSSFVKLGGQFENPAPRRQYTSSYSTGDYVTFPGGRPVRALYVYQQNTAVNRNSMTGKYFDGLPQYRTIIDCKEQPLDPAIWKEYPFQLHTWKDSFHTQSRTMNNLWLASIKPQNYAEINPADAERLGVKTGDWVKAKSPSSKHIALYDNSLGDGWYKYQVRVTSRIRPGLFSICQAYGRFGAGARKWYANGKEQSHDERVGAGFHINPLYMADPVLQNIVMIDPVGGGTQSYGTPLRLEKL
ncbi:MAG: molybdopterin-dependent oxidoreductase [Alphaproteobacteria bacterium]|uniref:Molybdopterin-dependent oxidoreductase n=1 Tax=Candidatus Nitrobium versatile TaxID=2884831 RepID=A0A953J318_9BACT|nr:molybdopterin-dependent oxidoreductase [Candidatus Nitrobium versatile]